jgi:hypothetical protein
MPGRRPNGTGGRQRATILLEAETRDEEVLDLLRQTPAMKQSEIARSLSMPTSTTGNRLSRLKQAGAVTRDQGGRWSLVLASPPAAASPGWVRPIGLYLKPGYISRYG